MLCAGGVRFSISFFRDRDFESLSTYFKMFNEKKLENIGFNLEAKDSV